MFRKTKKSANKNSPDNDIQFFTTEVLDDKIPDDIIVENKFKMLIDDLDIGDNQRIPLMSLSIRGTASIKMMSGTSTSSRSSNFDLFFSFTNSFLIDEILLKFFIVVILIIHNYASFK